MTSLDTLLNARSIAVVGASDKPGSFGGQVIKNLIDFGYKGSVCAVHQRINELFGLACYPSLRDIPQPPDCVALAVANQHLLDLLEEAADSNVRSAIVFGDPSVGAGRAPALQDDIAALSSQYGLVVCGPNAMGVYALHRRLVISGYPVRPSLAAGNVSLITHSGTVFDAMSQNNREVTFNYVISCGNEAVLTAADYLHHVLDDPTTQVVACYLETVRDPDKFVSALALARERQIPVVALKVGLSERGQLMTLAHTGALAGAADTYAALFKRHGVCQVHTLDEMMDTLELFSHGRADRGPQLAVLMESGGERSLVADLSEGLDLRFATLSASTKTQLRAVLDEGVVPDNPLDAFGTGHDVVRVYRECLKVMDRNPDTGVLVLAVDLARDSYLSPAYVEAVLQALIHLHHPLIAMVNLSAGANQDLMATLRANAIPVLMGTGSALKAISHWTQFGQGYDRPVSTISSLGRPQPRVLNALRQRLACASAPLDERESKRLLTAYGLTCTNEMIVENATQAHEAALKIGFPVVVKTAAPGVIHKSDVRGIVLNLVDGEALIHAYNDLARRCGPRVLVGRMAQPGVEMILGMQADPQFGPVLLVGMGGIFVEIYRDVATALAPVTPEEAAQLIHSLKASVLLDGARGSQPVARERLIDAVVKFSTFVSDLGDTISEIDINPLRVTATEAIVLDALIVPRHTRGKRPACSNQ